MVTFDNRFHLITPAAGGGSMVFFSGTVIEAANTTAPDWQRFNVTFTLDEVAWSRAPAVVPAVSLAAISTEANGNNAGWAVDRSNFHFVDGRIQLSCDLAVRGTVNLLRLTYQVTAIGNTA
ncbi:hypothetical protein P3T27_008196 [Kitasatospora sp. MAA19]|uniref:hypothetical protein n=1 Tax=Kitasatospora sp. MAA19 TaxID=3035090 RepID=UPI0024762041|nr:hypothetical protein [Kitasatospora sp. MAA19]MDH6711438.1 hypothetical protein [Kitasatospora sp. MAA19]